MKIYRALQTVIILLLTVAVQLGSAQSASAHGAGGILQTSDRPIGDYLLYAWTSPGIPRVGEAHLEVLIATKDGVPIDGCDVELVITSKADKRVQRISTSVPILTNQFRHEGVAMLSKPDSYVVEIIVSEGTKLIGTADFNIRVAPPSPWVKLGMNGMMISLIVVGLWFVRQGYHLANVNRTSEK